MGKPRGAPTATPGSTGLLDAGRELLHQVVHIPVLPDQARDLGRRMDDRRVVASPDLLADLGQRRVRQLAREIHCALPRIDDVLRPAVTRQLAEADAEALADEPLDAVDRDLGDLA